MKLKHFSHHHALALHHVPQGSEIQCSACKSPGSGNIYACWQCSYFLHEQCFRATRSMKHPAHPLHPLTLVPFPTYPSGSFYCNTCSHGGDGFSYSCSACEFDIHLHCALMPNPNPNPNPQVSPSPLPSPNFNSHHQNPTYPPIQTSNFPAHNSVNQNYPPQPQSTSYPPSIPKISFPNVNPDPHISPVPSPDPNCNSQPQNPIYNPPHTAATIPNATPQTYVSPVNGPTTSPSPPLSSDTNNPDPEAAAATIIKHFSHAHVLNSIEIEENAAEVCSACVREISVSAYSCTEPNCSFILDKACFDAPRELAHKSHPQHSLTLMTGGSFDCDACWRSGKGLAYTCLACSVVVHIDCVDWPETAAAGVSHEHALTLYYSGEDGSIPCNACEDPVEQKAWRYYCRKCGVGVHTGCCFNGSGGETEDVHTQLFKIQRMQMHTNFILQMSNQNAKFMASLSDSWKNF